MIVGYVILIAAAVVLLGAAGLFAFADSLLGLKRFLTQKSHQRLLPDASHRRLSFRTQFINFGSQKVRWETEADVPFGTKQFHYPPITLNPKDPAERRALELINQVVAEDRSIESSRTPLRPGEEAVSLSVGLETVALRIVHDKQLLRGRISRWYGVLDELIEILSAKEGAPVVEHPCLQCRSGALVQQKTSLGEWTCTNCLGIFLDSESARVFIGEIQSDVATLKDSAEGADSELTCPNCKNKMKGVFLDESTIIDLCTFCGSMWLDAGELSALSLGKYQGSEFD